MANLHAEPESRWTRRKELTRRCLLEAGEQLFRARGFDETTVEDIAHAADVAKGTFFNYFESKELLLGEIIAWRIQALLESPPAPQAPAWERVRLLLEAMWHELAPYRAVSRRILALTLTHPVADLAEAHMVTPALALANLIREGQAAGELRADLQAEIAATLLVTFFFRVSVLECNTEGSAQTCCPDAIHEGLAILHQGLGIRRSEDATAQS